MKEGEDLMLSEKRIQELRDAGRRIRKRVLKLAIEKDGCYLSQALSAADIFACLYLEIMNITESKEPLIPRKLIGLPGDSNYHTGAGYNGEKGKQYDRLLISPSHYAATVYSTLAECGRLSDKALDEFNTDGSTLEMIGAEHSPGFELTTGSFGQCISQAAGIAYARKKKGDTGRVFVFLSDGELQEGQTWEAFQAMAFYKLDNMIVYVDVNGQQVDGATKDTMNIEPIDKRFEAFGSKVVIIDGHDHQELCNAINYREKNRPLVILCYTDTCYGIKELEYRKPNLHYVRFKKEEMELFKKVYEKM